jgi:hypothetical protein
MGVDPQRRIQPSSDFNYNKKTQICIPFLPRRFSTFPVLFDLAAALGILMDLGHGLVQLI